MALYAWRTASSATATSKRLARGVPALARGLIADVRARFQSEKDQSADIVLAYVAVDDRRLIELTTEEDPDLADADAEVVRGEFATDEDVAATFAKFQL